MYNNPMKLVIQIPCYNEEENISNVLESIPKNIKGIDEVEILVLDDGSFDNTVTIAEKYKNVQVIKSNKVGLSGIFKLGLAEAIKRKADILINIDGDNQYNALDIEKLIPPVISGEADIVVGSRPISKIKTFSLIKKIFQKFGSFVVKTLSGYKVDDAVSGFRAYSKKALLSLNIFNDYTYTLEDLIQAKSKNLKVLSVDIRVNNQKNRKSKLFKNIFSYMLKQASTLLRFFIIYRPFRFFGFISLILFILGIIPGIRFLVYYFSSSGNGHIQSLILCSILLITSFIVLIIAIMGDLISVNRKLLEDIQYKLREKTYKK